MDTPFIEIGVRGVGVMSWSSEVRNSNLRLRWAPRYEFVIESARFQFEPPIRFLGGVGHQTCDFPLPALPGLYCSYRPTCAHATDSGKPRGPISRQETGLPNTPQSRVARSAENHRRHPASAIDSRIVNEWLKAVTPERPGFALAHWQCRPQ